MPEIPGLAGEVFFGSTETPLPDPAERPPDDDPHRDPEDEATPESRAAVAGMLGFDPAALDQEP